MAQVPMQVPGVGEVILEEGTLFVPISPELLEMAGEDWSKPLHVKAVKQDNGLVEFYFKYPETSNG